MQRMPRRYRNAASIRTRCNHRGLADLKGGFLGFGGTEMGGNENKRQKKLARMKSNRKKALTHKKKVGDLLEVIANQKLFLHSVNEPLYECFASAEMFDVGIGNVLISRR